MKKVNVIGAVLVDAFSWPLDKFPEPGSKKGVKTKTLIFSPGGGAANTSSALAQLGIHVGVFSKVGNDFSGRFAIEYLQKKGVDTSKILITDYESTAFAYIGVPTKGDSSFFVTDGTNKTFSIQDVKSESLFDCEILFYQDLGSLPYLDFNAAAILKEASQRGIITVVDENNLNNINLLKEVLPYTNYFMPGYTAMNQIMPDLGPHQIASKLREMGADIVVLKLSGEGCLILSNDGSYLEPSHAKKIVDTTGAGDCFDAGFIAGLATDELLKKCIAIGSDVASVAVSSLGGAPDIPPLNKFTNGI